MAQKPDIRPRVYKAEEDYRTALTLVRKRKDPVPDNVCFSAQQCVEKYLKAFLVHHRKGFPKTHDLVELLKFALVVDPLLETIRPMCVSSCPMPSPFVIQVKKQQEKNRKEQF
ncbi:MAG: HEPN domain-containing protein [Candidatus Binatia bacterium]